MVGGVEREGGGDGHHVFEDGAVVGPAPAGVIVQIVELAPHPRGQGVEPVEGLEKGGLTAFVLAHQAGGAGLEGHDSGVVDAFEALDSYRDETHWG